MKALVTGGNGFLGSWIVRHLVGRGDSVRVLHRTSSDMSALRGVNYEAAIGDVTDLASVRKACHGVEVIFHAAGVIAYKPGDLPMMEKVNVQGTANLVDAALEAGVKRFIHTSSVVAVGATFDKHLLNEDSPYEMTPYHFGYYDTKHKAEAIIQEAVKAQRLDAVIVNPGIMFGAGDAVKGSRKIHLKAVAGKLPFYSGGGVNVLDVEDAVRGHMLAYEKGRIGERYILGGENITVKRMFELLAEMGGKNPPSISVPSPLLRVPYYGARMLNQIGLSLPLPAESLYLGTMYHWYEMGKAQRELDFEPKPAADAIRKSVQWCFENGILQKSV